MADPAPNQDAAEAPAAVQPDQQARAPEALEWDDSGVPAMYTNMCRVTGTPEEIVVDCALNSAPMGRIESPVKVSQRLVMSFYTAKRLLATLHMAVTRHEQTFGVLETNVRKRARAPEPPPSQAP